MRLRMHEFCSMHIHTLIARTRCGVKQISVFVYAALKYVCRAVIGCKGYKPSRCCQRKLARMVWFCLR